MYNKGDIVKFRDSDSGYMRAEYDYEESKRMAEQHGFNVAQRLAIEENKGVVVLSSGPANTLVEYRDDKGVSGVLYFKTEDLELFERNSQEVINHYEIY